MQLQRDGARRARGEGDARSRCAVRTAPVPQGVLASAAHVLTGAHQVSHETRRRARREQVGAHFLGRGHCHHHGEVEGLHRRIRRSVHLGEYRLVGRALHGIGCKPLGEHPPVHEHRDVRRLGGLPRPAARVRQSRYGHHDGTRQRTLRRGHLQREDHLHVGQQPHRDLRAAVALSDGGAGAGREDHLHRSERNHRLGACRRVVHRASRIGPGPHAFHGAGDHR